LSSSDATTVREVGAPHEGQAGRPLGIVAPHVMHFMSFPRRKRC
jgi:hypothetical protein